MAAIVNNNSFCPEATWLVADRDYCVGTVQGMLDENGYGAIQNLGVVSGFRGLGLGCALLLRALEGFAERGAKRAFLEVTAANTGAVKLYRRLGFRCYRTIYREVEIRVTDPESVRVGI
jgi:ribosomal protein S18 acetylase RimI-like enzyme